MPAGIVRNRHVYFDDFPPSIKTTEGLLTLPGTEFLSIGMIPLKGFGLEHSILHPQHVPFLMRLLDISAYDRQHQKDVSILVLVQHYS